MNDAIAYSVLERVHSTCSTLLQPDTNCCSVSRAHRAAVIVDAERYFHAFAHAAECAERSILILAWDFNSRTLISPDPANRHHKCLGDFLNELARKRKRLQIRILDWDFPLVYGTDREFSPLYGLSWSPHRRIRFRYDSTHPLGGSHHQKIVVIDDKVAFAGGLDLTCRRWDTRQHRADDPRRVESGKPYPPFHDVMIAVDAAAARALGDIARKRWLNATGETIETVNTASDPWPESLPTDFGDVPVGIACTSPRSEKSQEIRTVERLYVDMIARAQRYIYIENQYFTSSKVGTALAARLAEPAGPEVVVVSRLLSHGWLEEMTMHVLRTRLIRELRAADRHGRFHIYYPHVEGLAENTCVDVHSKVTIVDDEWLRVGSANVSNRSMGLDTECDLVIEAAGSAVVSDQIRMIRDELVAEHLGVSPEAFAACLSQSRSLSEAIERQHCAQRTLKPLEDGAQWSEVVIGAAAIADPERPVSIDSLVEQFAPAEEAQARPLWIKAAIVCGLLLALTLAWRFTPLSELISPEAIGAWSGALSNQWWAPLLLVAAYTPASVIMFPRPIITVAAVMAFGALTGFLYALLGVVLAALAGYAVGRMLSRDAVRRIAGARLNRLSRALRQRGLLAMVLVRLVPVAPFVVVSLVAGAIRNKAWHFGLGTALGMLPGLVAATIVGQQLNAGLKDASQMNMWLLGVAVIVLAGGAIAVHRWLRAMGRDTSGTESTKARDSASP